MDTYDLSEEAYNSILRKVEKFHHDLTLQFGVLASECKDENEYLKESLLMIKDWESDIKKAIDEIFYENTPEIDKFQSILKQLKKIIKKVQKIPIDKRTFEEW